MFLAISYGKWDERDGPNLRIREISSVYGGELNLGVCDFGAPKWCVYLFPRLLNGGRRKALRKTPVSGGNSYTQYSLAGFNACNALQNLHGPGSEMEVEL